MPQKRKNTVEENEDNSFDDTGQSKRSKGAAGNLSCQLSSYQFDHLVNQKKMLQSDGLREVAKAQEVK